MPAARPTRHTAPAAGNGAPPAVRLPGSFEDFYLQEYPKVVKLAYALSGSRTGAEDIAQEAFLRAYRDWQRVGSYEHQAAWVRRVAANLATSGLRRRLLGPARWPGSPADGSRRWIRCRPRTPTSGRRCGPCPTARPRWWRCTT